MLRSATQRRIAGWCGLLLVTSWAVAGRGEPRVPGFTRFHQDASTDSIRGGLLLLGELNCVACHAADAQLGITPKASPRLDEVGSRVRPEYLREFLAAPSQADLGTTMPHLLHAANEDQRREQVEALVHFLASTGSLAETAPVGAGVQRGEKLFHSVGCVACHDPQTGPGVALPTSIPLQGLSRKYSIPSLAKFLQNPLVVRASGRMPQLNLTAEEARDIACYLLRDLQIPTSMTFEYYEGHWDKLPDFSQLRVKERGGAASFDVEVGMPDHFAVRFQGKFQVEKDGQYRFFLSSDDGSRLWIDGRNVLENDGIHGMTTEDAKVPLAAGEHTLVVEYFEASGGQELKIEYEGQGVKRQSLEFALVAPPVANAPPKFVPNAQLAMQGKELFQTAGCAACHEMRVGQERFTSRRTAKPLRELAGGGCLAEEPQPGLPFYSLSGRQRESLVAALQAIRSGKRDAPSEAERAVHTLTTFQCYACHSRDERGGVEPARNPFFLTNQPEMGDEGRIPPTLNGVGAKLRPEWLRQVVDQGSKERPYMLVRMPRFDEQNLDGLTAHLVRHDRAAPRPLAGSISNTASDSATVTLPDRRLKAVGRQLTGDKGMSCVKCHTWGNVQATGIQAISLTTMTRRLDPEWFRQYLLDPQRYRPGTRMPAAWPNGQSPFSSILDGNALHQIEAIWTFLTDGTNAAMPTGIGPQPIELVPDQHPIVYRNFLDRVGPRAIGVGNPERVHFAFDADACRLALIWQGAFLDASMHWVGRGAGFQKPLGDNVLALPVGSPFATLASLEDAWPAPTEPATLSFLGYALDADRRPAFQYRWGSMQVEDSIHPSRIGERMGLQRQLRIQGAAPAGSWFRVAEAAQIQMLADGWFILDGDWRLQVQAATGTPTIRSSAGRQELLVPLPTVAAESPANVQISFDW